MPKSPGEQWAEGAYAAAVESAKGTAPFLLPGYGSKELTPDEEDMLWDERHLSVEQEHDLWRQGRTPDRPGPILSPEEIGRLVFKNRAKLAASGGRFEPGAQIDDINRRAKRAEARRMAAMAAPEMTMDAPSPGASDMPQPEPPAVYGEEV